MKALREIGWRRACRYAFVTLAMVVYRLTLVPPLRAAWLRLLGARIGPGTIVHAVRFINLDRRGLAGLEIGASCFLGDDCTLDLAAGIRLGDHVTLATGSMVLTHLNVGFRDHPLQSRFPASVQPALIEEGSFVGARALILSGCAVGPRAFVAAGSVVTTAVPADVLVAGVPARVVKSYA